MKLFAFAFLLPFVIVQATEDCPVVTAPECVDGAIACAGPPPCYPPMCMPKNGNCTPFCPNFCDYAAGETNCPAPLVDGCPTGSTCLPAGGMYSSSKQSSHVIHFYFL